MSYWNGRAVLVTGGAGFGGAHLALLLRARGARVTVIDLHLPTDSLLSLDSAERDSAGLGGAGRDSAGRDIEFLQADICDGPRMRLLLQRRQFHCIFHLAAQPIVKISNLLPLETAQVNIMGTYELLEAVRVCTPDSGFIFASSGAYYGATETTSALAEDDPALSATNIYAPTKAAADLAVRCYARIYGLRAAVCRWMNTYGPGDTNFSRIIPASIRRLMQGERPLIDGTDGQNVLELLHVRDMASGYLAVAERLAEPGIAGTAFNFGSNQPLTLAAALRQLIEVWNEETGEHVPPDPEITGPPSRAAKYLDTSRARTLLGWEPAIPLCAGFEETITWYRQHAAIIS